MDIYLRKIIGQLRKIIRKYILWDKPFRTGRSAAEREAKRIEESDK